MWNSKFPYSPFKFEMYILVHLSTSPYLFCSTEYLYRQVPLTKALFHTEHKCAFSPRIRIAPVIVIMMIPASFIIITSVVVFNSLKSCYCYIPTFFSSTVPHHSHVDLLESTHQQSISGARRPTIKSKQKQTLDTYGRCTYAWKDFTLNNVKFGFSTLHLFHFQLTQKPLFHLLRQL